MRLLVSACLSLMTFSGSIGTDAKFLRAEFSSRPAVENNTTATEDAFVVVAVPSDRPIEIPTQTAIEPVLEPQPVPLPPVPKPVVHRSRQEVCEALTKAAELNDLPIPFFIRLLFQESGFQPHVVSRAGAQGVAQFMPETAASVGLRNPFDPVEAIPASARLLRNLFQQFGNLGLAAAAYNAGSKRIEAWLAKKGTLPQETQGYVKSITGRPAENWKAAESGTPEIRLPRRAPCQEAAGLHAWNGPSQIPLPVPSPFTRVATIVKTVKTAASSRAKAAKGAMQLTARNSGPKHAEKPTPAKKLRLAVAARGTHK